MTYIAWGVFLVSKKDLILKYLLKGFTASQIRNFIDINVSKQYISKVIKDLIKENKIEEVIGLPIDNNKKGKNNGHNPKLYKEKKPYRSTDKTASPLSTFDENFKYFSNEFEQPRLNLIVLYYKVVKVPEKIDELLRSGIVRTISGSEFIYLKHIFDDGRINFQLSNRKSLMVFIPERIVSLDDFRHTKQKLYEKAMKYANWFQKNFCCTLGLPEIRHDYHIAIKENDPFLIEFANKYGMLKIIDEKGDLVAWFDRSKEYLEFETQDENIAEIKAFMPFIVKSLQDRIFNMSKEVEALNMLYDALELKIKQSIASIPRIDERIESTNRRMQDLQESIDRNTDLLRKSMDYKPKSPDEKIDIT